MKAQKDYPLSPLGRNSRGFIFNMKRFLIYLDNQEYAKTCNDPCFGGVVAENKKEAEAIAVESGLFYGSWAGCGAWAVEVDRSGLTAQQRADNMHSA